MQPTDERRQGEERIGGYVQVAQQAHVAEGRRQRLQLALLEHDANPDQAGITGITPLYIASSHGNLPVVKVLITNGANPMLQVPVEA